MARVAYVGDEVSGAGYCLAGARIYLPAPGEERAALERACAENELVLLSRACAERLSAAALLPLLRRTAPLLLVVPDGAREGVDITAEMKRRIGFQT
jgi:vacuolar-type H+-ATPase subunit F/Vma7